MNDNAQKWVEALRSGRFQQGQNQLRRDDNTYCCLGVACELYHEATGQGEWDDGQFCVNRFCVKGESSAFSLPSPVQQWLRINSPSGVIDPNLPKPRRQSLIRMNDLGKSFDEIADFIEANEDKLFV